MEPSPQTDNIIVIFNLTTLLPFKRFRPNPARRIMNSNSSNRLPRTFWWHNIAQFGGAMNDNLFKLLLVYALLAKVGPESSAQVLALIGLVFALPFLLIVPFAGTIADKFSKRRLIVTLKGVEVAVMSFGVFALTISNPFLLYTTMFLMSSQSAFFGPCKYGLVPEQVSEAGLSKANGILQLFTFLAIISGTILAPELSLLLNGNYHLCALACVLIALLGFFASLNIEPSPSHQSRKLSLNGYGTLLKTYGRIRKDSFLLLSILALGVFGFAAGYVQLNVLDYGVEHLKLSNEEATRLFLLTAIGIGLGSVTAGWLSGRSIEFGIVPIGAVLMSGALFALGMIESGNVTLASIAMITLGIAAGLFIVPLEAFIQFRSPKDRIGEIQAANSFTSWIGILLASGLIYLNSSILGWTAQSGFLVMGAIVLCLSILALRILPDFFVKFIVLCITRICYRLKVRGLENLPNNQGALLVCNHVSLMDAVLVASSQQRRVRMLMSRNFYEQASWPIRRVVDLAQVILIHDSDGPKQLLRSLKTARAALDEGYLVCIFAEGALSRTGMMRPFKPGFERIVKGSEHPIIPVYIGGAWGSISSYKNGMPRLRPFSEFRYPVSVHYGSSMPSSSTVFEVQQAVSELSVDAANLRKSDCRGIGSELLRSTRRNWDKTAISEISGKQLTYGKLLTATLLLRKRIENSTTSDEQHIGILLPTGIGAILANTSLSLSSRIGVNLNYTTSPASFQSALNQCAIRTVISSRRFTERFPELPLPEKTLYIEDLLEANSTSEKLFMLTLARLMPERFLIGSQNPDSIATVLFSSGSTAEPKGIQLSHYNILSNIASFRGVLQPSRDEVMLATLPLFHSFGYTATMWFSLLSGLKMACHNNPLEAKTIGELSERERGSILLTTPSFLLAYIRKVKPEQFSHLKHVFTGAEKLQPRIADMFEKRFGTRPLEGYGATELSPVCALSLPNVTVDKLDETGSRPQRLGRVLPGMAIKIVDPTSGKVLPEENEGLICIKGPNVMSGYLHRDDLTQKTITPDGWYQTGDMGVLDGDGFFAITGRLSRFSKIAGEMVSLGAVEQVLQETLHFQSDELAVIAIANERKGEMLCVLSKHLDIDSTALTKTLKDIDIPNLWKPNVKNWHSVNALPVLGSGKLDYQQMKKIVEERVRH